MLPESLKSIATPTTYCRQLLNIFGTSQSQKDALLVNTGLTEKELKTGPETISLLSQLVFAQNLHQLYGPGWMLEAEQIWSPSMHGALGFAFRSSPTVKSAIETIQGFAHLRAPHYIFSNAQQDDAFHLKYRATFQLPEDIQQPITEAVTLSGKALLDNFINPDTDYLEIWWQTAAPPYQEKLESFFSCPCRYNMNTGAIIFKASTLSNISPFYELSLQRAALRELKRLQNTLVDGDYFRYRVSQFLEAAKNHRPTVEETASALGVSKRTLSRRLQESDTTFRILLDNNLKQRAIQMRDAEGLSRVEIAERLGFQDPTSLSRAWRRWFEEV